MTLFARKKHEECNACNAGYALISSSTCQHVNACQSSEDDCVSGAVCNHIQGSSPPRHTCVCPAGFRGNGKKSSGGSGCTENKCKAITLTGGVSGGSSDGCTNNTVLSTRLGC